MLNCIFHTNGFKVCINTGLYYVEDCHSVYVYLKKNVRNLPVNIYLLSLHFRFCTLNMVLIKHTWKLQYLERTKNMAIRLFLQMKVEIINKYWKSVRDNMKKWSIIEIYVVQILFNKYNVISLTDIDGIKATAGICKM